MECLSLQGAFVCLYRKGPPHNLQIQAWGEGLCLRIPFLRHEASAVEEAPGATQKLGPLRLRDWQVQDRPETRTWDMSLFSHPTSSLLSC
jgi:hypothetical protein